jgi:hypothetical protein
MAMTISVGKNVARILDREFPIDSDLFLKKQDIHHCAWNIRSQQTAVAFDAIKEGEVTPEAFRTYNNALHKSIAFNERGKLRKLFDRKEEGVKIVPGHGVFMLPSKMQVVKRGPRDIAIRVFGGTEFAETFHYSDYENMVAAAAEHYFDHIREVTDAINESLWYPVKYNKGDNDFEGIAMPAGVHVGRIANGSFRVRYYSAKEGKVEHFGVVNNTRDLVPMILEAADQRHKEQMVEAHYRFVHPRFVMLSQYMRSV